MIVILQLVMPPQTVTMNGINHLKIPTEREQWFPNPIQSMTNQPIQPNNGSIFNCFRNISEISTIWMCQQLSSFLHLKVGPMNSTTLNWVSMLHYYDQV